MPAKSPSSGEVGALFDAHASFVWRVLKRHGVPLRELPDGCQEVFLVVHRRFAEFEGRASVRTWLYAIAVRVAARMRRKSHLVREQLAGDALAGDAAAREVEGASPLEQLARKQQLAAIDAALATLSRERREVFVLYELEGMTMTEVAVALSLPENTALYRLYAAREQVRGYLERRERPPWQRTSAARGTR